MTPDLRYDYVGTRRQKNGEDYRWDEQNIKQKKHIFSKSRQKKIGTPHTYRSVRLESHLKKGEHGRGGVRRQSCMFRKRVGHVSQPTVLILLAVGRRLWGWEFAGVIRLVIACIHLTKKKKRTSMATR